jgi:hypothetical protein
MMIDRLLYRWIPVLFVIVGLLIVLPRTSPQVIRLVTDLIHRW